MTILMLIVVMAFLFVFVCLLLPLRVLLLWVVHRRARPPPLFRGFYPVLALSRGDVLFSLPVPLRYILSSVDINMAYVIWMPMT